MSSVSRGENKIRVNVYLPKALVDRIDEEAKLMGTSRGGIISQRMNQFYLDMDTQVQLNNGIKALTGMDNKALTQMIIANMLKGE